MQSSEEVLLRIIVGENDRHAHRPVHEAVLDILRNGGIRGATVLRGIAGYGAGSIVHTQKILDLTHDLPMVVEAIDGRDKIEKIIPLLDNVMSGGLVTLQTVQVLRPRGTRA